MKGRSYSKGPADSGFSILEILVAMAVLMLMALMVVGLVDGTMRITSQSQRRISADAGTRQALDRMSADFARAIVRSDLPIRIEKEAGNDSITFFAQADGYTAGRGISKIGYRVANNSLQRGAESTGWTNNAMGFTTLSIALADPNYLTIADSNFETIATDVFRLEFAFLMGDGTITNAVGTNTGSTYVASMATSPRSATTNTIRAVIVGIATLDARARRMLPSTNTVQELMGQFPDATSGSAIEHDILTGWDCTNAALPQPVRESLRINQRQIRINN
jgi:type II secretory pathway component PulJ